MKGSLAAGSIALVAILLVNQLYSSPYDNYVLLADAIRHGHVWIDWPGQQIDAVARAGRYYVIEAPLPAILILPAVVFWGTATNQTLLAALLASVAIGTGWEILRRLDVALNVRIWLCAFLLLGTDLFWCAMYGDVWFLSHVSAVAFTLLALCELLGARRGWLVALFAAAAAESRFTLLLALPVYAVLLATNESGVSTRRRLLSFALTLIPFAALSIWYNELRWGLPYDIGYDIWFHEDAAGAPYGSPFSLSHLGTQLYFFLLQSPATIAGFPFLVPTYNGVALTWTSPALVLAAWARKPLDLTIAMCTAAALVAAPNLLYYVNGYPQFGMRHALDFEPFLIVLMGLGARQRFGRAAIALCAWSIFVGLWGIWYWKTFYRPL